MRIFKYLFACFLLTSFVGCLGVKGPKSPQARLQTKTGTKIEASGDAENPAKVSETESTAKVALPSGSTVDVIPASETEPEKVRFTLARDSEFVSTVKTTAVEGPKAFAPEKAPTPTEIARGQAVLWSYALAGVLLLGGGLLLYLQHTKAGVIALLGSPVVPIAANLLSNSVALAIGGAFLLISATLYSAWHLMQRNRAAVVVPVS